MRNEQNGISTLRVAAAVAAIAAALAAFSGPLATQPQTLAQPASQIMLSAHQDPSLAGLSVSEDAEPGDYVEPF